MDLDGVKQLGPRRWSIRVKRTNARTGKPCNRRATIDGTRADAVRKRDELRAELANTTGPRGPRQTLRAFTLAWLEARRDRIKPSVARKYLYSARHALLQLGELLVEAIVPSDIDAYVSARIRAGAAGHTVLNELRMLRAIARSALRDGATTRYFCDGVKPPKVARYNDAHPNLLKPEQAERVLQHVPPQWLGLVLFLMVSGLRIGEATALRWDDVDVDAGVARIQRGNYRGEEVTTKTDSSDRVVPVLPEVARLWGARRAGELVFPARGRGMHRGSPLRRVLEQACAAAGVPRVTTHGLRRTFNNTARSRGDREVLKATTGHTTDEMVEHYSLVDDAEKTALSRAVAAAIGVLQVSGDRTLDDDK